MAFFDPFQGFDIDAKAFDPKPPTHHKKKSTFANVPFQDTQGFDDFVGFSVEETKLNAEIEELKDLITKHEATIQSKNKLIDDLCAENLSLKTYIQKLELRLKEQQTANTQHQQQQQQNTDDSNTVDDQHKKNGILQLSEIALNDTPNTEMPKLVFPKVNRETPSAQIKEGSAFFSKIRPNSARFPAHKNHAITESFHDFLNGLDIVFKNDEAQKRASKQITDKNTKMRQSKSESNGMSGNQFDILSEIQVTEYEPNRKNKTNTNMKTIEKVTESPIFISNPIGIRPNNGQFQLRRSSLSEEEQERLEQEAVKNDSNGTTKGNFNENENENVSQNGKALNEFDEFLNTEIINEQRQQIQTLKDEMRRVQQSKVELIINTSVEINRLRDIIKQYISI